MKYLKALSSLLFLSLLCIKPGSATASVVINEVYPNPQTGEPEWIELYNPDTTSYDISTWKLQDVLSTPSVLHIFTNNTFIEATSYLTIDLTSQKLNNTADGVILFDQNGSTIDSMNYSSSETNKSWSRINQNEWILTTPTKGIHNPVPTPTPSLTPSPSPSPQSVPLDTIRVISFSPCPNAGEQEFIELQNTSSSVISISNWTITDSDNNTKLLSGELSPQAITILSWSGALLNNSGDSIIVKTATETTVLSTEYGECERGKSFVFYNNQWVQDTLTPSSSSQITAITKKSKEIDQENTHIADVATISAQTGISGLSLKELQILSASPSSVVISHIVNQAKSQQPLLHIQSELPKRGITHVIIGGLLISFSGILPIYEKIRLLQTSFLG